MQGMNVQGPGMQGPPAQATQMFPNQQQQMYPNMQQQGKIQYFCYTHEISFSKCTD